MPDKKNYKEILKEKYDQLFLFQRHFFDTLLIRRSTRKKIKTYPQFKNSKKDREFLKKANRFLKANFNGYSNTLAHYYFSDFTKIKDVTFIPSDLYFTKLEPAFNDYKLSPGIDDKISYELFMPAKNLPETLFKIINYKFYNSENNLTEPQKAIEFLKEETESLVLKPAILSGGGKNVMIEKPADIAQYLTENPDYKTGSFVVQRRIIQHKNTEVFHPGSVNTYRIMTARVNSEIVVLSAYLRMGRNNSRLDNGQSGGLFCRITEDGKLDKFAYDKNLYKTEIHPDSNIKFENYIVPSYKEAKDFCFTHHKRFLRFTFISWDIAIGQDGTPIFIEFNLQRQSIHGHQIINGPLFGKHVDYFIQQYNKNLQT